MFRKLRIQRIADNPLEEAYESRIPDLAVQRPRHLVGVGVREVRKRLSFQATWRERPTREAATQFYWATAGRGLASWR